MAIESSVLVIGGGLAGATAALAARETGAEVRLLSHKESTLPQASGLIDVLGYTPDGEGPLVDPFGAVADLPDAHPYRLVGRDAIEAGLTCFDDLAGDSYVGNHTESNALVPTAGGRVKPTARYPRAVAPGLASIDRDTLLVGFERLPRFDAPLAAERLEGGGVPFEVRGVTVEWPTALSGDPTVTRLASLFDADEPVGGDARRLHEALAERVAQHLEDETRIGFPAILGRQKPERVRADLSDALDVDVFEVPTGPPSVPGLRLADRVESALDDAGVRIETGNPVVDAEAGSGSVDAVVVDRTGSRVRYAAEEVVLATGGLVGKGLDSDREAIREPIFDCHVPQPDERSERLAPEVFGDHPFARFGVAVDRELRPLDRDGEPEFDNLRAAGAVLGGYDFAAEKSGSGVSLATGHRAGRLAGEAAS